MQETRVHTDSTPKYKKQSKAEDIYEFIIDQILEGRWKPGDRLNDQELADEIQVSRISVREALFKLLETGIVEKIHWKGYFLKSIDESLIQDIVEIRVALETLAIKNMLEAPDPQVFLEMKETIDSSELHLKQNEFSLYMKTDFRFHELLYSRQKNRYIATTLNNYLILIHFIRVISMGSIEESFINAAKDSIKDHRLILDYLKKNDLEKAQKTLREHLGTHENKTMVELQQSDKIVKDS